MTDVKMKELTSLANELNELMGFDEDKCLPTDPGIRKVDLEEEIHKVAEMLEPDDKLTQESIETLEKLGIDIEEAKATEIEEDIEVDVEEEEEIVAAKAKKKKEVVIIKSKAKVKKEVKKETKSKDKEKVEGKKKMTRLESAIFVIKFNKIKAFTKNKEILETMYKEADSLFEKNGGTTNESESKWAINMALKVISTWNDMKV